MLIQKHVVVRCKRDGNEKPFYYAELPSGKLGLRYGCNDKQTCPFAYECWANIKRDVLKKIEGMFQPSELSRE